MTVLAGANLSQGEVERLLRHYEGLVCKTAQMLARGEHPELRGSGPVEDDEDDIRQLLRLKVYRAIIRFDPSRVRVRRDTGRQRYGSIKMIDKARDGYVNMCVRDQVKDIVKKKRRGELMIEDIASGDGGGARKRGSGPRDAFEARYLSVEHDETFHEVEDDLPVIPNTLSERERRVLVLMYRDYRQTEIAEILNVSKRDVESAVRAIRTKLADWRPQAPTSAAGGEDPESDMDDLRALAEMAG